MGIDMESVRAYFPSEEVVKGMLEIYSRLLHLSFERVPDKQANVWHPSVTQFLCWDARPSTPSGAHRLLGTLYLDLWPRDGKYSHAACWTLIDRVVGDLRYRPCVTAVLANFQPGSAGVPSLLPISEVRSRSFFLLAVLTCFCSGGHAVPRAGPRAALAVLVRDHLDLQLGGARLCGGALADARALGL